MSQFNPILFAALLLASCDGRESMRTTFPDDRGKILTDQSGHKYMVKHHIGDTYSVDPIDEPTP